MTIMAAVFMSILAMPLWEVIRDYVVDMGKLAIVIAIVSWAVDTFIRVASGKGKLL